MWAAGRKGERRLRKVAPDRPACREDRRHCPGLAFQQLHGPACLFLLLEGKRLECLGQGYRSGGDTRQVLWHLSLLEREARLVTQSEQAGTLGADILIGRVDAFGLLTLSALQQAYWIGVAA